MKSRVFFLFVLVFCMLLMSGALIASASSDNRVQYNISLNIGSPIQNPDNGHYYQLVEVVGLALDWLEARDAAAAMVFNGMPGHLATVTSPYEENFIVNNFPDIYQEYVWLGASDEANEGHWQWITGEVWDYTDWAIGEPNGETDENCLDYGDFSAQWNDESCDRKIYFYLVEYSTPSIVVQVDIKPGSDPNAINCHAEDSIIPVAILSTEEFEATSVDHTTVTFEGASEIHFNRKSGEILRHEEDVDADGDIDLVFHFRFGETDLTCESTTGTLTGLTFDGLAVRGWDTVQTVPPNRYYSVQLSAPGTVKTVSTFGLLGAGLILGLALVIGIPARTRKGSR